MGAGAGAVVNDEVVGAGAGTGAVLHQILDACAGAGAVIN